MDFFIFHHKKIKKCEFVKKVTKKCHMRLKCSIIHVIILDECVFHAVKLFHINLLCKDSFLQSISIETAPCERFQYSELDYDNSAVDLIILELLFWARNATIRHENEKLKKTSNLRNFT